MATSLAFATIMRTFLVIISYGCKVPAGIFVPSMAIGASFGRMVGILVQALHERFPHASFFRACEPDVPCITPGTYAFLGAGAALSGIMHLTVSVVVIMFELTGALEYILPTMACGNLGIFQGYDEKLILYVQIVVGITKAVGDWFGKGGIADRMIWFNGFPFLDNKEEHAFGVPVSQVMTKEVTSLPSSGMSMQALEQLLSNRTYQGFPVVENRTNKILLGYIGRTELLYAISRAKRQGSISPSAKCLFTQSLATISQPSSASAPPITFDAIESSSEQQNVDFSRFIDPTPLAVHPRLPLETVMELFKKMGPRVILIEYRGRLAGLVTVKDCLKYQFKFEALETSREDSSLDERHERLWRFINLVGDWVADSVMSVTGGRVKLGGGGGDGLLESDNPLDRLSTIHRHSSSSSASSTGRRDGILEGTEEDGAGVELQDRRL